MTEWQVTQPGVIDGMPDDIYHADPALSYSGAKLLLPPSCPAKYKYQRDHGRKSKAAWDLGHAVHKLVLGVGPEITVIEADDWRTNAAKAQRAEAYAAGAVPLLRKDYEPLAGMVASVRAHPLASSLLDPGNGTPEVSLFHTDERTGVNLRSRLDFLPHSRDGRMILPDLKSAASAEPVAFARSAAAYSYHVQSVFYQDMVTGLGLAEAVAFVFVVVETEPPHLVSVRQLDDEAERIGRALKQQAIDIFAECTATDTWPGYSASDQVELIQLPRYYVRQHEDQTW